MESVKSSKRVEREKVGERQEEKTEIPIKVKLSREGVFRVDRCWFRVVDEDLAKIRPEKTYSLVNGAYKRGSRERDLFLESDDGQILRVVID